MKVRCTDHLFLPTYIPPYRPEFRWSREKWGIGAPCRRESAAALDDVERNRTELRRGQEEEHILLSQALQRSRTGRR